MAKNYINKEEITEILKITEIEYDESNETYDYSYPYLIKGMEELRLNAKSKEEWVIIGSSMVYSWMPRILNFTKSNNYKKFKESLLKGNPKVVYHIGCYMSWENELKMLENYNYFYDSEEY